MARSGHISLMPAPIYFQGWLLHVDTPIYQGCSLCMGVSLLSSDISQEPEGDQRTR